MTQPVQSAAAPVRLIACDIDGTLLQPGEREISPAVFRHIHRLREKNIRFCPASGRQYRSLRSLFAPVADELSYVCENGAVVFGPGEDGPILGKTAMDRAAALTLAHEILADPRCEVLISGVNTSYLCPKQPDIVEHIRFFVGNNVTLVDRPEDIPEDILKVSAYCRPGAEAIQPDLAPRWTHLFHAAIAGAQWLDFNLADKGVGLAQLCRALDIPPESVLAFGDNFNDVPMLELAGQPYLMDNAAPALRARFPLHCRRVEDILAQL